MFHVIVLLNPLPASFFPRTDLANLMVFYKDLNERFISENPANTVSEPAGPYSQETRRFLPRRREAFTCPGEQSHTGRGRKLISDMHLWAGPALSSPYLGPRLCLSSPEPCAGAAQQAQLQTPSEAEPETTTAEMGPLHWEC